MLVHGSLKNVSLAVVNVTDNAGRTALEGVAINCVCFDYCLCIKQLIVHAAKYTHALAGR